MSDPAGRSPVFGKERFMKFGNLGIKSKIMSGSIFPMVGIVIIAITGILTLQLLSRTILSVDGISRLNRLAAEAERNVVAMENGLLRFLVNGSQQSMERFKLEGEAALATLKNLKKSVGDHAGRGKAIDEAIQAVKIWQTTVAEPVIQRRKGTPDAATVTELTAAVSTDAAKKPLDRFESILKGFIKETDKLLSDQVKYGLDSSLLMEDFVVYGVSACVLLTLCISYLLARKIADPLLKAVGLAEAISHGDLTRSIGVSGTDEVGRLAVSLDAMVENLRNQISQMSEAVTVLSSSSSEIASTVSEVAASTSQTSSAVTETTSTVSQVKQAAMLSSEKAKAVAQTAQKAVQTSASGSKATEATVHRMNLIKEQMESIGETVVRLSEHSRAIEEIVATVQDLADQSNLLAVNASIEAARAGDQGKGFAVVAYEIKALSDQSREATDQIRTILDETRKWVSAVVMATEQGSKAVEAGVEQSNLAGESIQTLSQSVAQSAQAASLIETTSDQQTAGVDQVADAMSNIEQAMHQNTTGTRQIERAAIRLDEVGLQLKQLVERYHV
jgi:methyl-accepting chemotaxis protein